MWQSRENGEFGCKIEFSFQKCKFQRSSIKIGRVMAKTTAWNFDFCFHSLFYTPFFANFRYENKHWRFCFFFKVVERALLKENMNLTCFWFEITKIEAKNRYDVASGANGRYGRLWVQWTIAKMQIFANFDLLWLRESKYDGVCGFG